VLALELVLGQGLELVLALVLALHIQLPSQSLLLPLLTNK
jgi:hypothetical protein